jgi:hypothetical protein
LLLQSVTLNREPGWDPSTSCLLTQSGAICSKAQPNSVGNCHEVD